MPGTKTALLLLVCFLLGHELVLQGLEFLLVLILKGGQLSCGCLCLLFKSLLQGNLQAQLIP